MHPIDGTALFACMLIAIWYPAWVAESVCRIYASLHAMIIRTTTGTGAILIDFKDNGPAGKQPASADRRPDHLKRMRACGAAAEAASAVCRLESLRGCQGWAWGFKGRSGAALPVGAAGAGQGPGVAGGLADG